MFDVYVKNFIGNVNKGLLGDRNTPDKNTYRFVKDGPGAFEIQTDDGKKAFKLKSEVERCI